MSGLELENLEILNFAQEYFYIKDCNRRFIFANLKLVELFRCRTVDEVIGKTDFDFVPDYLAVRYEKEDRRVIERGDQVTNKIEILSRGGRHSFWHVTSKLPLRDQTGAITGLIGCTRALDRKRLNMIASEPVAKVLSVIDSRFSEDLKVSELAKMANLSISALERRFKKSIGATLVSYLRDVRLNEACRQLAESDASLSEIAYHCGYCDQSYFTTEFSRALGITPLKYRKQYL
jgi:AraC-like DNA-binding protein